MTRQDTALVSVAEALGGSSSDRVNGTGDRGIAGIGWGLDRQLAGGEVDRRDRGERVAEAADGDRVSSSMGHLPGIKR